MKDSKIAWTDHTFNPWVGCVKVSPGCANCYAEALNNRWGKGNWGADAPRSRTSAAYWKQPLAWNEAAKKAGVRARVFCASMADVGEDREDLVEARRDLSVLIERTPWLDWLLLTKRPENLTRLFARWQSGWPSNVWVGTSVENQAQAERVSALLQVPAAVRFLSVEPLLEEVNICQGCPGCASDCWWKPEVDGSGIHWLIVGGESGPKARPFNMEWARSLKKQAQDRGVAFFMKQLGGHPDKREDPAGWPEDLRVREFPLCHPPKECFE